MAQRISTSRYQPNNAQQSFKKTPVMKPTAYVRDLVNLLPLWTEDLNDTSHAGRLKVLAKLRRALRIERQNGTNGHWSYDLARHKALLDAYRREVEFIRSQKNTDNAGPLSGVKKNKK